MAERKPITTPHQDRRLEDEYPGYGSNVMGTGSPGQAKESGLGPAYEGTGAPGGGAASEGGNTGEISTRQISSTGPEGRGTS